VFIFHGDRLAAFYWSVGCLHLLSIGQLLKLTSMGLMVAQPALIGLLFFSLGNKKTVTHKMDLPF
jgi:hypothetical protein